MAAKVMRQASNLIITGKVGVDKKGKELLKKSNLGKVLPTANEQDIFDVAKGIEKILEYPLIEIERIDHNSIIGA